MILSHPTGNQNVRNAALAIARAGMLDEFWTCIQWREGGVIDRVVPANLRSELRRRSFPLELSPFIRTWPVREWGRQVAGRLGASRFANGESAPFSVDAVYDSLDRRVARRLITGKRVDAVYAYDGGALKSFRAAKQEGIITIYEHPITHWRKVRRLQEEEADLHPEWRPTLRALLDSAEKFDRKDEEIALADLIIAPSAFARDSLSAAPINNAPIHIIPYGAPPLAAERESRASKDKLKVLFVGGLSQAKGLGYLLEAAQNLESAIELTLIGQRLSPSIPSPEALSRWRWFPSLAHSGVIEQMAVHDVLVLPSLHEGFPLVLLEAMSQSLPVIASHNTGAGDLIVDGREGFLIPIRSADAIQEKLEILIRDRMKLREMAKAARQTAGRCSWEAYGCRLNEILSGAIPVSLSPSRSAALV